jgi:predicted porin
MFGGLMKSTSVFALAAVAGLAFGGISAKAADLGGDCCADLEERVAELEATTARKGNRKVSLTVYGQVSTAVMFWDADQGNLNQGNTGDPINESNVYVVDPQTSGTRFGFKGNAKITPDVTAGFQLELQWQTADWTRVTTFSDEGPDLPEFRQAHWYLKSETLGKIRVGHADTANSSIAEINVANTNIADGMSSSQAGQAILFELAGVDLSNFEFNRKNIVRYDTPTFAGFILSAAWGEDDIWDVALRYAGEWFGFKMAAGIAYGEDTDNCNGPFDADFVACGDADPPRRVLNGGASIMHVPTGLFVTGSAGQRESDAFLQTEAFWFANAGIEQKWSSLGKTSIFGMAGDYEDDEFQTAHYYGGGIVQSIDAAAMDLWISYRHYDLDSGLAGAQNRFGEDVSVNGANFDVITAGGIIKF